MNVLALFENTFYIHLLLTLVGTPMILLIHAVIKSANQVAAMR